MQLSRSPSQSNSPARVEMNIDALHRKADADVENPPSIAPISTALQPPQTPRSRRSTRQPQSDVMSGPPGAQVTAQSPQTLEALESQRQITTPNSRGTAMIYANAQRVSPLQLAFTDQPLDVDATHDAPARERRVSIDSIDWCDPCGLSPAGQALICFFIVCMGIGAGAGVLSTKY